MRRRPQLLAIALALVLVVSAGPVLAGWQKSEVDSGDYWMLDLTVGDGDGDKNTELYGVWVGVSGDLIPTIPARVYQISWGGSSWQETPVRSWSSSIFSTFTVPIDVAVGDGNDDDGEELYVGCGHLHVSGSVGNYTVSGTGSVRQFLWGGSNWVETGLDSTDYPVVCVQIGDGNNDAAK